MGLREIKSKEKKRKEKKDEKNRRTKCRMGNIFSETTIRIRITKTWILVDDGAVESITPYILTAFCPRQK